MSSSDYLPIMCKLANIPLSDDPIDGQVPIWFGGNEIREFAYSESLHPGDPYYAAIFAKDEIVYFESEGTCTHEGRFYLGDYKIRMLDYDNQTLQDEKKLQYYESIILDHIGSLLIYE